MVNKSLNNVALFVCTETIYRISSEGQEKGLVSNEVLSMVLNSVWNNIKRSKRSTMLTLEIFCSFKMPQIIGNGNRCQQEIVCWEYWRCPGNAIWISLFTPPYLVSRKLLPSAVVHSFYSINQETAEHEALQIDMATQDGEEDPPELLLRHKSKRCNHTRRHNILFIHTHTHIISSSFICKLQSQAHGFKGSPKRRYSQCLPSWGPKIGKYMVPTQFPK